MKKKRKPEFQRSFGPLRSSLIKQPAFGDATTGFPAK